MGRKGRPGVRRRETRDKAQYNVKHNLTQRRSLIEKEKKEFLSAIDQNVLSLFGIVKLSSLDLDVLLSPPHPLLSSSLKRQRAEEEKATEGKEEKQEIEARGQKTTLLNYAVWMGRTQIANALLRAGASPFSRSSLLEGEEKREILSESEKKDVTDLFSSLPPQYSVWLLSHLSQMRQEGIERLCERGIREKEKAKDKERSPISSSSSSSLSPSSSCPLLSLFPLSWKGTKCSHLCCEHCLWRQTLSLSLSLSLIGEKEGCFVCPVCRDRLWGDELQDREREQEREKEEERKEKNLRRKEKSLELFLKLPKDKFEMQRERKKAKEEEKKMKEEEEQNKKEGTKQQQQQQQNIKKKKFEIGALWEVKSFFIGTIQTTRTSEWFKAAKDGDVFRLKVLFENGVDVDAQNEYGETALLLCVFHGRVGGVQFLVEEGAVNLNICTLGGSDVWRVAIALQKKEEEEEEEEEEKEEEEEEKEEEEEEEKSKTLNKSQSPSTMILEILKPHFQHTLSHSRSASFSSSPLPSFPLQPVTLIPKESQHPGAGSFYIDSLFSPQFLSSLVELFHSLPFAVDEKVSSNRRKYFCDSEDVVRRVLKRGLEFIGRGDCSVAFPYMRFLYYCQEGASLAPHVDLSRTDIFGVRSKFTFILYLSDCEEGGETAIVSCLNYKAKTKKVKKKEKEKEEKEEKEEEEEREGEEESGILAVVKPKKGRLFVFPHFSPHEGLPVIDTPKLLLRGELY